MVSSGEVNALVPERVWKEFEKALVEKHPEQFFQILAECNALPLLFPQINHHGLTAIKYAVTKSTDPQIRFASLFNNVAPEELEKLCQHYKLPNVYKDLAWLVTDKTNANIFMQAPQSKNAEEVLAFLIKLDAFRREERFKKFLSVAEIITHTSYVDWWLQAYAIAKNQNLQTYIDEGLQGIKLGQKIKALRLASIQAWLTQLP